MESMTESANTFPSPDPERLRDWVERVATFFVDLNGLPPITGRIVGWLLICDPAEQSAGEIASAVGASRASLTTSMRLLTAAGLVRKLTRSGGRTAYYRVDDDMWEVLIRRRIAGMLSFSRITEDGITLIGADNPRARRLRAAHDFFDWMAATLAGSRPRAESRRDETPIG